MDTRFFTEEMYPGTLSLTYLGQEGFYIRTDTCRLLVDPYLTDYVDVHHPGAGWVRKYPSPVTPEEIAPYVDYVFCTHDHDDHTDPWTVASLATANPHLTFFVSRPFAHKLPVYGVPENQVVPVDTGKPVVLPGVCFTGIPAAHEELHPCPCETGGENYEELGFRFTFGDGTVLYHAGDCCPFGGLAEAIGQADVMLLPVNGRDWYRTSRGILGNMNAVEAVHLAKDCGADMVIPMHYDLYAINGIPVTEFVHAVEPTGLKYHLFRPGERLVYRK